MLDYVCHQYSMAPGHVLWELPASSLTWMLPYAAVRTGSIKRAERQRKPAAVAAILDVMEREMAR